MGIIKFLALGAGQGTIKCNIYHMHFTDVGRSCVVVTLGGRTIMFDCGMHMGYNDERRFPDFTLLSPSGSPLDKIIDCVIITHFHLDHCGALPYMTEMCGYNGPVIMTHPTKALCPILLEDYRRISVERKGESNFFTPAMIRAAINKVVALNIHESHWIEDIEIIPFYAGHVLGAAMFYVKVGNESVMYTGDYNMTPDRHLGAASVDLNLRPDVLITESTYATTLRDSKRARERDFLRNVHQCVSAGGKVLIPVFALGRVQELCVLVEDYWERMGLTVPVYFSAGMAESANAYYKVFIDWTNEKIQNDFPMKNAFDFKYVRSFEKHFADHPGPMVLFSSPGMLHSGMSLEMFKKWCDDDKNLLIIPGFCVSGTVGAKILAGQRRIELEDTARVLEVKMQVKNMSFSAHADARGIMQLIRTCKPRNVVLVHGEAQKMTILKGQIIREMGIPCFDPPNGHLLHLESSWDVPVIVDDEILEEHYKNLEILANRTEDKGELMEIAKRRASARIPGCGNLLWSKDDAQAGLPPKITKINTDNEYLCIASGEIDMDIEMLARLLQQRLGLSAVVDVKDGVMIECKTLRVKYEANKRIEIEWKLCDSVIAEACLSTIIESKR